MWRGLCAPPLMPLEDTVRFLLPRLAEAAGAQGVWLCLEEGFALGFDRPAGAFLRSAPRPAVGLRTRLSLVRTRGEILLEGAALAEEEAREVGDLCDRILENSRRYQELLETAATDDLTGLPNRGFFRRRLQEEIERCARVGGRFALMFLDVDGLKRVNDSFGHLVGDDLLPGVRQCQPFTEAESPLPQGFPPLVENRRVSSPWPSAASPGPRTPGAVGAR